MAKKTIKKIEEIDTSNIDLLEKRKMADLVVSQIRSTFGQGSILKMDEVLEHDFDLISTGSLSVDLATGVGGIPKGRIIEIFGPESSGKTSLALSTIAQAQRDGGIAAYIDAEHALDPQWASKLGVKVDELYLSQPNNGEEALEIVDNLVRSNAFDIIVIDSVAALVPKSEIEGNMGESSMGVQARLMSQALRKLTGAISKSNTSVVFINQIRLKIGVMFGSPETTTGGEALKFFASLRFDIRKIGQIKNSAGEGSIGSRVRVKIVKNKMAAPFKIVEFDMMFDEPGVISLAGEIIDIGSAYGIIEKTGNTYTLNSGEEQIKLGVGRESAKKALYGEQELMYIAKRAIMDEFHKRRKEGRISTGTPTPEEAEEAKVIEEVEKNLNLE
jgi:recombination protein RecA